MYTNNNKITKAASAHFLVLHVLSSVTLQVRPDRPYLGSRRIISIDSDTPIFAADIGVRDQVNA